MITDTDRAVIRMQRDLVSGAFRQWREAQGLTIAETCRMAGVAPVNMWRWETGRDRASRESAMRLLTFIADFESISGEPLVRQHR